MTFTTFTAGSLAKSSEVNGNFGIAGNRVLGSNTITMSGANGSQLVTIGAATITDHIIVHAKMFVSFQGSTSTSATVYLKLSCGSVTGTEVELETSSYLAPAEYAAGASSGGQGTFYLTTYYAPTTAEKVAGVIVKHNIDTLGGNGACTLQKLWVFGG